VPVTLLAVDDSVTMRKVLEMTFAGEDYRVVTADSTDAALALARVERPGVVVADITLEGKTGYDLCQALKREMPNVPVLLLCSKLHPYDAGKGQSAHADDHIDKPFDSQQLIDKVRTLTASPRAAAGAPAAAAPAAVRVPVAPTAAVSAQRPAPVVAPVRAATQPMAVRPPMPTPAVRPQDIAPRPPVPGPAPAQIAAREALRPQTRPMPIAQGTTPKPSVTSQPAVSAAAQPAAARAPAGGMQAGLVTAVIDADMAKKLVGMGLNKDQIDGVLALSRDIVERVVWEVVPVLAETMIKEEIRRLTVD
jgi:CheY-like chemotaxis protein